MDEQRYPRRIGHQDELRLARGIRYQPTFDINGRQVVGMSMFTTLDGIIKAVLVNLGINSWADSFEGTAEIISYLSVQGFTPNRTSSGVKYSQ